MWSVGRCYVQPVSGLQIFGVPGLPEIVEGTDLAASIVAAATAADLALVNGDIVVVTSKIVSKAEGRTIELVDVEPSAFAIEWSAAWDKDPAVIEVVLREARRIVRQSGPVLITETHHGFVCANSGVDQSSSGAHGRLVLLPTDPDASARRLRAGLAALGVDAAVIISDTFGRPWRRGLIDVAIGVSGIAAVVDLRDTTDALGRVLQVTEVAVADEIASAAELVMGKATGVPVAIVRGIEPAWLREGSVRELIRPTNEDLFR